jgi:RNA polymerase sigma-70 factor (ECF subfamily)
VTSKIARTETLAVLYERAFEDHWGDVLRFSLAWTNDLSEAEELSQEVFLRLWQRRVALDWDRPILPWLLTIARRLATDRFRSIRRRILPRSVTPSLDESVRDRWIDVRAAMAALSPLERTAVLMTSVQGWSYDEVALALGTTSGAIRAAASRGREKLEVA